MSFYTEISSVFINRVKDIYDKYTVPAIEKGLISRPDNIKIFVKLFEYPEFTKFMQYIIYAKTHTFYGVYFTKIEYYHTMLKDNYIRIKFSFELDDYSVYFIEKVNGDNPSYESAIIIEKEN